ncbi:M23 family metallopeptidase [Dethiobacter alkaliphilus]|uniref:M23 family metallopeptidase n=1 Tax=Dethiobacter alkaliphilus TaxID=427926 RepID=UPI0022266D01|nr:M23 family metallopeptidase [Dethiobacter alkaliphilus]MCW3488948.1 M23 family metallopeptidase [Dethiobacter alkaliphilus]
MHKEKLTAIMQTAQKKLQAGLTGLRQRSAKLVKPDLAKFKAKLQSVRLPKPDFTKLLAQASRINLKYVGAVLAVGLILATSLVVQAGSYAYVVYVDDDEVGLVSEEEFVTELLAELNEQEEKRFGLEVSALQEVRVEREQRRGEKPDDWEVKDYLRRTLDYNVYAYVIYINGRSTLAVESEEDYETVLEGLKNAYVSGDDNAITQAVVLNDQVEARRMLVEPDELYTAETATQILARGTDRRETYLVSRGDSLWTIARNNNLTVSEIKEANPQIDDDSIKPGEELDLLVSEPLVNVSVTEDVVMTQRIPYETKYQNDSSMYRGNTRVVESGKQGTKEVTYRITTENGHEVKREMVSEEVVQEPEDRIVARGTAAVPAAQGTGRFQWPVSGGGRITSQYGPRGGGFHRGVDIATSSGTPVLAADSGRVTQAGWSGGYGLMVTIDHGNGYVTRYAHNSSNQVSVGQTVQRGQQIARIGSTGNSTGPHLHFEVLRNGSHVNPMQFF